jgi:NADH dehydrogenase FAD-containing subunit
MTAAAPSALSDTLAPENPAHRPRQLVLLGSGDAHLHVLATLAAQPMSGVQVTLVAPHPRQMVSGMVPGFIANHYPLEDCVIPLEPLVKRSGIRWLQRSVVAVDAQAQTLALDDASALHFDWLSVNTAPVQNREAMEQTIPGAREHGLFARPIEAFAALWPRVAEMGDARPLRVTVIGAGAAGIEMALAVRHRLPTASVTLLSGLEPAGARYPQPVQQRLMAVLKARKVTVLQDVAVALKAGAVQLGCGADLACDVPLLATGVQAPAWLANSGLTLDDQGCIAVDAYQRSTNHSRVFAAGAEAARAGPALLHNLAATTSGSALQPYEPSASPLHLLACGDRYAVGSWGKYSAQGRWVWWLKDAIDRRFMARYARPAQ